MLNLKTSSAPGRNIIWVNAIRRILQANLEGIIHGVMIGSSKSDLALARYVNYDYHQLLPGIDGQGIRLLLDLNINTDEDNRQKLLRIWSFMISQTETCLQGTAFHVFDEFIKLVASYSDKDLNMNAIW